MSIQKHYAVTQWLLLLIAVIFAPHLYAQETPNLIELYNQAIKEYEAKDYKKSAEYCNRFIAANGLKNNPDLAYDFACIFSLNGEETKATELLVQIITKRFYSDYEHISQDIDLNPLHDNSEWEGLLNMVKENLKSEPERSRKMITRELLAAKRNLTADGGRLWGGQIWNDSIIITGFDNTIYSFVQLPDSETKDGILFYKTIPENTLTHDNTTQLLDGKRYVTIAVNYLEDSSSTIIHELFHFFHHKKNSTLNGNSIGYLDGFEARKLMRLEFHALKNALKGIDTGLEREKILAYINDAFVFRKIRQSKYKAFLKDELEIETLEGLANYTGIKLSSASNKYLSAISEINEREHARTFTRPFPYATGPAYGLIFDFLNVNWRTDLTRTFDFLKIYETQFLEKSLALKKKNIKSAKARNDYDKIQKEESAKKEKAERIKAYYTRLFLEQPTLSVVRKDSLYSGSYDMYNTFFLLGIGTVYADIKGTDMSGKNFGNYITTNSELGVSGVLVDEKWTTYTFPKPIKIEDNKITGENYIIYLNPGWKVITLNKKGDLGLRFE